MNTKRKLGAVLLAVIALAILPAAATITNHAGPHALTWLIGAGLAIGGTVTVTYSSFVQDNPSPQFGTAFTGGSNVAPSALQAAQVNRINALIGFTDADTTITLTHNWNETAAAQAAHEPDIIVVDQALGSSTTTPNGLTWVWNTNTVVGTKANTAGSGRTIDITLRLPATPGN
jgi:hypothetical protein